MFTFGNSRRCSETRILFFCRTTPVAGFGGSIAQTVFRVLRFWNCSAHCTGRFNVRVADRVAKMLEPLRLESQVAKVVRVADNSSSSS